MLFTRSLRVNFLLKLIVAMATLVLITSFSLYLYIRLNSNSQIQNRLQQQAQFLLKDRELIEKKRAQNQDLLQNSFDISAKVEKAAFMHYRPKFFRTIKKDDKYYIQGFFPYNFQNQEYIVLTKDITKNIIFEQKLYKAILFINLISLVVIIFYAFFLSKMLIRPIKYFSSNIAKMNEKKLAKLELKSIPKEFKPLGASINQLISKIENFIYYKKDLFIGAAHELKTPLAVMKTKSQVTLIKKDKSIETLTQALEQNIKSINNLNAIVESILAFGRAEGAQFEEAREIDIIKFISNMVDEFELVAIKEEKYIIKKLKPKSLTIKIQPMLLRHILQNLIQNAIKFSPIGSKVTVSSFRCNGNLIIRVKDNGPGLPKNFDLFAPFKRGKNSKGTGLGLFLAKSAADSLGAIISLNNRKNRKGSVATLILKV